MRADRYDVVAHMGFPLKGFIPACLLPPSPSLFLSSPSLSLPAAAVSFQTETFFAPIGCQTHTHTHISMSPMDLVLSECQSPLWHVENQTPLLLDWHPPREQSRVEGNRGESREQRRTPENKAGYDKRASLEKSRTQQQGQSEFATLWFQV